MTPWLVIVLLLGNFLLMAFDAKQVTSGQRIIRVWTQTAADFVQSPVTTVTAGVTNYFASIANLRNAQSENDALKEEVQKLQVELQESKDLVNENERLRGLLDLKQEGKYKALFAQIIGRDPSIWFDSSIVNRGSMNGVKLNMPVVTKDGLIGRVSAVSPLTAQVDLITRDNSGVGGIVGEISGSNALGVVKGTGKSNLVEMRYVPGSIEVQVGQIVYTSGQEGIYPPGIKIGEIVEVVSGSATTPHKISIRPTAGLDSMQEVAILLYEPPPQPEFEQKIPNAVKDTKKK